MKYLYLITLILSVFFSMGTAQADDAVTAHILTNFNEKHFKEVDAASSIPAGGIAKLWGWLKIQSTGTIKPITYYLEWEYRNSGDSEILGNYNTNKEYLEYTRKLDRTDDYYWVSKRVWVENQGVYIFRIYVKGENGYDVIKEEIISIGGQ